MSTHSRQRPPAQPLSSCTSDELDEREVRRHLLLFHQVNQALCGPVPATLVDLAGISTVLDVFCGTGGWALDLACGYPHLRVTGIDASERAVASARRLAREGGFANVCFRAQDLCCPPATEDSLPGAPFDLIHTAFLAPHLLRMDYPALLRVLWRLCRPGGLVCWTEMEFPLTNSPAFEQLMDLTYEALANARQNCTSSSMPAFAALFSPQGHGRGAVILPVSRRHLGLTSLLGGWFMQTGYQQVQQVPTAIEVSFESEAYACFTSQVEAFLRQIRPFLLAQQVVTAETLEALALQAEEEVRQDSFCGLCWLLTVLGQKPGGERASPLRSQ